MTIHGYVRDIACLMRHPDALKPTNECALECVRDGSPFPTKGISLFCWDVSGRVPRNRQVQSTVFGNDELYYVKRFGLAPRR